MNKIGIITLNGYYNYGNRLQNYALQKFVENYGKCKTIWNINTKNECIKNTIKSKLFFIKRYERLSNFVYFTNKYIRPHYTTSFEVDTKKYDKYIVGSDQVWNWTFSEFDGRMLLDFSDYDKSISYAASFGVEYISDDFKEIFSNGLSNIKYLSVREDRGKEVIKELTNRSDVAVLIDPTMLLTRQDWDKIAKRPKQFKIIHNKKYILNYFLGNLSESRKSEIEKIARENDCVIINLLDKNDPFYVCGPSEFLYLEKNAFLICTDSFHSSVFAILYNRPFIIFGREQNGIENMNSRLDTLINKFKLKNRRYNGKNITKENLEYDYTEAYEILEMERKKSKEFIEKALDIKE